MPKYFSLRWKAVSWYKVKTHTNTDLHYVFFSALNRQGSSYLGEEIRSNQNTKHGGLRGVWEPSGQCPHGVFFGQKSAGDVLSSSAMKRLCAERRNAVCREKKCCTSILSPWQQYLDKGHWMVYSVAFTVCFLFEILFHYEWASNGRPFPSYLVRPMSLKMKWICYPGCSEQ